MPRITHVEHAQQRYATKPVLDADGDPKTTVLNNPDGTPRTDKYGRTVTRAVTVKDTTKPLPPEDCDYCHEPIAVGAPYKHVSPRSGPYGGTKRSRHRACPTWAPWDLSNSLSARVQRVQHEATTALEKVTGEDEARDILGEAAAEIQALAEEKREAAQNMVDGFGHDTEPSMALEELADALDTWAGEIEGIDLPEFPEPEEDICSVCEGSTTGPGGDGDVTDCSACKGTGLFTPAEPTADQLQTWVDEVIDNASSVLDETPDGI